MPVEQMIYTSCRRGLGAGAGFQTQAVSPGLTLEDRRELERVEAYHYPRGLPINPSVDDIERFCPPCLRLKCLSGGARGVTRLIYARADYSGRPGNYLAHSIVLPPDVPMWPIDLALWQGWHETVADEPPVLTALDAWQLGIDTAIFDFTALAAFIKAKQERVDKLASVIQALLLSRRENRALVIRDMRDVLPFWVACVSKLFPRRLTEPFLFATFVDSLSAGIDIQCTTPDSDIRLSSEDFQYRAFVFDFVDHRFSDVGVVSGGYAQDIAAKLCNDASWFQGFHQFADHFAVAVDEKSLRHVLDCFSIYQGASWPSHLDGTSLADVLGFAGTSPAIQEKVDLQIALIERVAVAVNSGLSQVPRPATAAALATMTASLSGGPVVEKAWITCKLLLSDELSVGGTDWQRIESALNVIGARQGLSPQDLRTKLWDDAFLDVVARQCGKNRQTADAVFRFVFTQLAPPNTAGICQEPLLQRVIAMAIEARSPLAVMPTAISVAAEVLAPDQFAMFCVRLANSTAAEAQSGAAEGLALALDGSASANCPTIRRGIWQAGCGRLLLGELNSRLKSVDSNPTAFLSCLEDLYDNRYQGETELAPLLRTAWLAIAHARRQEFAGWLAHRPSLLKTMDSRIACEIAQALNDSLSFESNDSATAKQAKTIEQLCKSLGFVPAPNRVALHQFVSNIQRGAVPNVRKVQAAWEKLDNCLDPVIRSRVVKATLTPLLAMCQDHADHWSVLLWSCSVATVACVAEQYVHLLRSELAVRMTPQASAALALATIASKPEKLAAGGTCPHRGPRTRRMAAPTQKQDVSIRRPLCGQQRERSPP